MKSRVKEIIKNTKLNWKRISFEGVGITIFLILVLMLIASVGYNSILEDQENLNIFDEEKALLDEVELQNRELQEISKIVGTDEFRKLLARDVLGLAREGEELFTAREEVEFFEKEIKYLNIDEFESYTELWNGLM